MGRKAKGENLGRIMLKDIKSLSALNDCGRFKQEHFDYFNIPPSRVSKMVWDGYAQKKTDINGDSCWNITKEGRDMLARETGEKIVTYKPQGSNDKYYHDYKVADMYCFHHDVGHDDGKEWINETELRNMWDQHLQEVKMEDPEEYKRLSSLDVSAPDGAVRMPDGTIEVVEAISRWYTEEMIESKITFCEEMNMTFNGYYC